LFSLVRSRRWRDGLRQEPGRAQAYGRPRRRYRSCARL